MTLSPEPDNEAILSREDALRAQFEAELADQIARADELESELDEAILRIDRLDSYIRHLERQCLKIEARRLQEKRRRQSAQARLKRLKARKWWRLAGVLGRWRKSPLRIDRLISELYHLARDRTGLPAMPDLSPIENQIEELVRRAADLAPVLRAAELLLEERKYEDALAKLDELPVNARRDESVFDLRRRAYIGMGELSQQLRVIYEQMDVSPGRSLRRRARAIEGRLIETDTTWLPDTGWVPPPSGRSPAHPNRILHVVKESLPFYERGYTMRSHATFLAQREAGFEPVVTTSLNFPREQGFSDFAPLDVIDGIQYHRLDLGPEYELKRIPYDLQLSDHAAALMQVALEQRPALLQAGSGYRGYDTALVGLAVARALDIPFIYEMRSFLEHTWTGELGRSEAGEYYRRRFDQEVRCLSEADHVITIAETMRQEIVSRGIPADKVTVVPNVVDVDRFSPRSKDQQLASTYGIEGQTVLGYVSNLGQREGIPTLIEAVAIMRRQGRDVVGFVPGEGPEFEALQAQVTSAGLDGSFILPGHIDNSAIENHYSLIDIFVVPRIDDRASRMVTPLKPLEAMAMQIPVIASDLPALEEMVAPGERGMAFKAGDPHSLAEVAGRLIDEPALVADLTVKARSWVESERDLSSNARRYKAMMSGLFP